MSEQADPLTALRHRHLARVAGGWWTERDRDIQSLLNVVAQTRASRDLADRIAAEIMAQRDEALTALLAAEAELGALRARLAAFREAHYRRVYGEG